MTERVTLTTLPNLRNDTSNTEALNENFTKIAEALDNTVSRTGEEPNQLEGDIDANSQRIFNLPEPATDTEPLRVKDVPVAEIQQMYADIVELNDNVIEYATIAEGAALDAEQALSEIENAFSEGGIKFQIIDASLVPVPAAGFVRLFVGPAGALYVKNSSNVSTQVTASYTGVGTDASLLSGQAASYYTNIVARLGYTPLNKAGDTATGQIKGITPVANEDLTRKDYVDGAVSTAVAGTVAKATELASPLTLNFTGGAVGTVTFDGNEGTIAVPLTLSVANSVESKLPVGAEYGCANVDSGRSLRILLDKTLLRAGQGTKTISGTENTSSANIFRAAAQPSGGVLDRLWVGHAGTCFASNDTTGELYALSGTSANGEAGVGLTAAFNSRDANWDYRKVRFTGAPANATFVMTTPHYSTRLGSLVISNGRAYYAGQDSYGQAAQGSVGTNRSTFVEIARIGSVDWAFGWVDGLSTFLVDVNGSAYGCGWSGVGNLGTNSLTANNPSLSLLVDDVGGAPLTNVVKIRTTKDSDANPTTYVLTSSGILYATGYNGNYNLGKGDTTNTQKFVVVTTDVSDFAVTGDAQASVLAVKSYGALWGWGRNLRGELGVGTTTFVSNPVQIKDNGASGTNITGVTKVWGCISYSVSGFYIKRNGKLYYAGIDRDGSSGLGVANNSTTTAFREVSLPEEVSEVHMTTFTAGSTLYCTNVVKGISGKIYTAGQNGDGQCGVGSATDVPIFTEAIL